ncbi:MAG: zinc-ribbon domain-containing protein [Euryarchaeota archaeon]|nr:zinc-ribbon domain-containing protein [Euryarchaeota archaeon]
MRCPQCGTKNSEDSAFCVKCGTALTKRNGELSYEVSYNPAYTLLKTYLKLARKSLERPVQWSICPQTLK